MQAAINAYIAEHNHAPGTPNMGFLSNCQGYPGTGSPTCNVSNMKKADGTGWIYGGDPALYDLTRFISELRIDPRNTNSGTNRFVYFYFNSNGTRYKLSTQLERNISLAQNDGGFYNAASNPRYEVGTYKDACNELLQAGKWWNNF
jgi:hypothetical protein